MLGSERLLPNSQTALVEWLGRGMLALILIQRGQIVERPGHVRVFGSQSLFIDRQAALKERLGR
jgi:hypothetical protein